MPFEGTVFIDKEAGKYVARCPELGVSSRADTMLEVLALLKSDVKAYLERGGQTVSADDIHLAVMRVEVEL